MCGQTFESRAKSGATAVAASVWLPKNSNAHAFSAIDACIENEMRGKERGRNNLFFFVASNLTTTRKLASNRTDH
jgi:hypothetical protein